MCPRVQLHTHWVALCQMYIWTQDSLEITFKKKKTMVPLGDRWYIMY